MNKIFFLLIFYFFVSVKSEKVNCNGQPRQDIRTKLVHLLEVEPFREFFSEVPHFFMSTIKYKNAIKQSRKGKNEDRVASTMATELVKLEECGCERKIKTSRPIEEKACTKSLTQAQAHPSKSSLKHGLIPVGIGSETIEILQLRFGQLKRLDGPVWAVGTAIGLDGPRWACVDLYWPELAFVGQDRTVWN